jgi:ribosomal protein S18 acetylase RimI-like enzyme
MGERLFNCEPVLFMALRNYAESIPVGFIQLYSICSLTNAVNTTIINDLYVLPDYRKNGIALKLIEVAVKFAINNKSAIIQLETLQNNRIAQKLFESVGFKRQNSESDLNVYSIQFEFD